MDNNTGFKIETINEMMFYTINSFNKTGLVDHAFTSRIGGVSPTPYSSLNLGTKTKDSIKNVEDNFRIVSKLLNMPLEKMIMSNQVHGTNIKVVDKVDNNDKKFGFVYEEGVDGFITNLKNVTLCTFHADCVPIFYLDPIKNVVGLAHAGWKGTVNRIAGKMIELMHKTYDSSAEDILIGIGPSIGPCCFEVKDDVCGKFLEEFSNHEKIIRKEESNKWKIDLWKANEIVLEEKGILNRNITTSNLCTGCNKDKFFSYRKENGITGRMAALIKLV